MWIECEMEIHQYLSSIMMDHTAKKPPSYELCNFTHTSFARSKFQKRKKDRIIKNAIYLLNLSCCS